MKIEELIKEATLSYEENKIEDAILYLETVLELDSNNLRALMMLCKVFASILNFKEALKYAEKAYKNYNNELEVLFTLGYLNQEIDKNKKALIYYEKYIEKEENYYVFLNMGICYMDLKYFKKAIEMIDKAILKEPNNVDGYFDKAECYLRMNEYEKVIDIYENKLKNMEQIEEFYLYMKMAEAYHKMGNVEEAIKYYNITINSDSVVVPTVYEKFFDLLIEEDKEEEIELLLINYQNSQFPREYSLNLEARYCIFLKDYERIRKVYEKLIMLDPNNPINYLNLVYSLDKLKKYDEALEILEKIKNMVDKEVIKKLRTNIKNKIKRALKKKENKE